VAQVVQALIGKLGENVAVRVARYEAAPNSVLEGYVHGGGLAGEFGPNEGRVGVLLALSAADLGPANRAAYQALAHDLALHITVHAPRYVADSDIPAAELEEQRARLAEELVADKKPEAIKAKIVQGRLDKFTQAVCLLPQPYLRDDSLTVAQLLERHQAKVERFVRFEPAENAVGSGQ
jgi:elongation factor Ts